MKIRKSFIGVIIIGLLWTSCSTLDNANDFIFSNENIVVTIEVDKEEFKEFKISIKNVSNNDMLILIPEVKVLTLEGTYASIMSVEDALSEDTSIEIKDIILKANESFKERYVAVGYLRKQILKDQFVLLPWIDINQFEVSLPYMIKGKKYVLKLSL